MYESTPFENASCSFVNPLTVLSMLEIVKAQRVGAVIHTGAASALGRMMIRHFQQSGVKVIGIVHR